MLKLNIDGAGYYRTHYSDDLLDEIVEALRYRTSCSAVKDSLRLQLGASNNSKGQALETEHKL